MGKTLNSTGLVMYIATISTITDIMMLAMIRKSSRNPGMRRDHRHHDAQHRERNTQFRKVAESGF